jgi:hypothetical protein
MYKMNINSGERDTMGIAFCIHIAGLSQNILYRKVYSTVIVGSGQG